MDQHHPPPQWDGSQSFPPTAWKYQQFFGGVTFNKTNPCLPGMGSVHDSRKNLWFDWEAPSRKRCTVFWGCFTIKSGVTKFLNFDPGRACSRCSDASAMKLCISPSRPGVLLCWALLVKWFVVFLISNPLNICSSLFLSLGCWLEIVDWRYPSWLLTLTGDGWLEISIRHEWNLPFRSLTHIQAIVPGSKSACVFVL